MKTDIFLHNYKHIFFVGIGGISLSGLAKLCLHYKIKVSGSDISKSSLTEKLKKKGANVFYKHSAKNIENDVDLVVFSSAISKSNPEIKFAKKQKIPLSERAEFLNIVCKHYKNVIAIAGMHGKTTTCGMLASVFVSAKLNPTVHIGGESQCTNGNFRIGTKNYFITEACEYKDNFLKFVKNLSVVLNIEMDHPDYFDNINMIYKSFSSFCNQATDGYIINEKYLTNVNSQNNYFTFNYNGNANFTAKNIVLNENMHYSFDCYKNNQFFQKIILNIYGEHNILNALAVCAVADYYKIAPIFIQKGIISFNGIKRRFELICNNNNCQVIHDYAHHPTEIVTTITCAKKLFNKKIICVFQPHTYSRTKKLLNEFLTSFNLCDEVIFYKTYSAREKTCDGISAYKLSKIYNSKIKNCGYFADKNKLFNYLNKKTTPENLILILGAGDIDKLANMFKL